MEFKNRIINDQIRKWTTATPDLYNVFHNYRSILKIADELSEYYNLSDNDLARIVDGIIFLYLSLKKDSRNPEFYEQKAIFHLKPLFDQIIKQIDTDSYKELIIKKQITEEDILEVNNIKVKINANALLHHSKKTKKPLTTIKDAEELERDLIKYKKQLYQEQAKTDKTLIVREINKDNLYPYFNSVFKGKGNGSIDYFTMLVQELQTDRTAFEFAQIAYLIYNSKYFVKRECKTFSKWNRFFFAQINIKYVEYKPWRLKSYNEGLQKIFSYLTH